jgi:hypothetical protein
VCQRRIEREERGIVGRHDLDQRQCAVARVHPEHVNANGRARMCSAGRNVRSRVCAHIDEPGLRQRRPSRLATLRSRYGARRGGSEGGRSEERKKLTTRQAGRRWFPTRSGIF